MNRKAVSRMLVVVTIYGGYSIVPVTTPGMILQVTKIHVAQTISDMSR